MPATVESPSARRDSTFTYDDSCQLQPAEMERLRAENLSRSSRSSEHLRNDSVDSGIGAPQSFHHSTSLLSMKRTSSDTQHRSGSTSSVSDQMQVLLQSMVILEKKLKSMESQMKNEQVQRLALEAKVVKLERDNEQLKSTRTQAGVQLQNFAEIFYSETETIKLGGSCNASPNPSLVELRRRSRTDSLSSSSSGHSSSRGSRFSNDRISM